MFNPTETKKNGPARRPASAPARRRGFAFTAALVVLPATSQRLWRCLRHRQRRSSSLVVVSAARVHSDAARVPAQVRQQLLDALYAGQALRGVLRELGLTSNRVLGPTQIDDEWATASNAQTGDQFRDPAAPLARGWR
jgi:hypothetical protein